jgi:phage tail sheath protein FI
MVFVATNKAPGIYIDEIQLPGAIAGVGTSTAAFVGPAKQGPMNKPEFLTSWTQFVNRFGSRDPDDPLGPFIVDPLDVWATHAVRGFFDNGGKSCYFVRIGLGRQSSLKLKDKAATPRDTLVVTANQEGTAGDSITVEVQDASIVTAAAGVVAIQEEITLASATGKQAIAANAADAGKFFPGDIVLLFDTGKSDRVTVASVSGTTINLQESLTNTYGNTGKLRIADLNPGQRRIRLNKLGALEVGSAIKLDNGTKNEEQVVQSIKNISAAVVVVLARGLTNPYGMDKTVPDPAVKVSSLEFTLILKTPGTETYQNLSMDPRHSRYFGNVVDSAFVDVTAIDPPNPTIPPANRPVAAAAGALGGGANENLSGLRSGTFTPLFRVGIDALEPIDEVNMLCVPDRVDQDIQAYMVAHCEKMQDRFAILDPRPGATPSNGIVSQRNLVSSDGGYAALYYPRVLITNPVADGRLTAPPSGHIAGLYARTDNNRGVHKAPANDTLRGVLALERTLTDDEQGPLNEIGVNVIRQFTGSGIRVWGARTIVPKDITQWRYINVRRLLLFIEESIQEGTRFAVFEPNDLSLWGKVNRQVTDFLTRVWRDGALFGATPEEAFRVRIDEELNPPSLRQLGQLIIEVVLFPTTPAEFIVFRIIQQPGGPVVQE